MRQRVKTMYNALLLLYFFLGGGVEKLIKIRVPWKENSGFGNLKFFWYGK